MVMGWVAHPKPAHSFMMTVLQDPPPASHEFPRRIGGWVTPSQPSQSSEMPWVLTCAVIVTLATFNAGCLAPKQDVEKNKAHVKHQCLWMSCCLCFIDNVSTSAVLMSHSCAFVVRYLSVNTARSTPFGTTLQYPAMQRVKTQPWGMPRRSDMKRERWSVSPSVVSGPTTPIPFE